MKFIAHVSLVSFYILLAHSAPIPYTNPNPDNIAGTTLEKREDFWGRFRTIQEGDTCYDLVGGDPAKVAFLLTGVMWVLRF
jgi:hypothetical protein